MAGDAWLAVQATDGSEAYTRRGDLSIAASGVLETGDGFPVMGSGGPITVPPADKMQIAADGTISILPLGAETRSEEHTSELQSLMSISSAVFCLKKTRTKY